MSATPRNRWRSKANLRIGFALALIIATWIASPAHSQTATIKDWQLPYRDPDTGKLRFFISGQHAKPDLKSRRMLLQQTTITNFNAAEEATLILQAPECTVSLEDFSASSPGQIEARSPSGQFTITGTGFMWSQTKTNSSLVISNEVRTIIRRDLIKAATLSPSGMTNQAVEVLSKRFEYDSRTSTAVFKENVRVTEPGRLKLTP